MRILAVLILGMIAAGCEQREPARDTGPAGVARGRLAVVAFSPRLESAGFSSPVSWAPDEPEMHIQVTGGSRVESVHSWPSVVALLREGADGTLAHYCGATMVAKSWAVTAAHCGASRGDYVLAGRLDLTLPGTGRMYDIERVVPHAHFDADTLEHDIALLRIVGAPSGQQVARVARAGYRPPPGTALHTLGWGVGDMGEPPFALRHAGVSAHDQAACIVSYEDANRNVLSRMVCALDRDGGPCQRDSGGPLYQVRGRTHLLVGVVSFNAGCASPDVPSVYTAVSAYHPFFRENGLVL